MSNLYNDPIGHWVVVVLAMAVVLFVLLTGTAYAVWFERVALGHIQRRPGPNRVGPWGLMQSAADGIKLAFKESFIPAETDRIIYVIAPTIAVAASFLAWSVIPIGLWYNVQYWIADVNVGVLLIFAVSSLNVYAIVLGGYASNNKYSLLGSIRASSQLISYELALTLSVVGLGRVNSLALSNGTGATSCGMTSTRAPMRVRLNSRTAKSCGRRMQPCEAG